MSPSVHPRRRNPIPDGAYTGTHYAVMAWDEGDTQVECLAAGPSLRVARQAVREAAKADPSFDHVELVQQTVTHGSWAAVDAAKGEPDA